VPNTTKPAEADPAGIDDIRKLVKRAQGGDASTLPVLRKMLRDPATVDWFGGDLARQAELSLIDAVGGDNLAFKEALTRKLELLRADLAGPDPTPVERLLVERVVACWLQLHHADIVLAQQGGKLTLEQGEYHQRCRDRAHKRYLSAIKTLALVRKLALPVLQVNIGRRQVNVAGACPVPPSLDATAGANGNAGGSQREQA
jgi:hypothetical protein